LDLLGLFFLSPTIHFASRLHDQTRSLLAHRSHTMVPPLHRHHFRGRFNNVFLWGCPCPLSSVALQNVFSVPGFDSPISSGFHLTQGARRTRWSRVFGPLPFLARYSTPFRTPGGLSLPLGVGLGVLFVWKYLWGLFPPIRTLS